MRPLDKGLIGSIIRQTLALAAAMWCKTPESVLRVIMYNVPLVQNYLYLYLFSLDYLMDGLKILISQLAAFTCLQHLKRISRGSQITGYLEELEQTWDTEMRTWELRLCTMQTSGYKFFCRPYNNAFTSKQHLP